MPLAASTGTIPRIRVIRIDLSLFFVSVNSFYLCKEPICLFSRPEMKKQICLWACWPLVVFFVLECLLVHNSPPKVPQKSPLGLFMEELARQMQQAQEELERHLEEVHIATRKQHREQEERDRRDCVSWEMNVDFAHLVHYAAPGSGDRAWEEMRKENEDTCPTHCATEWTREVFNIQPQLRWRNDLDYLFDVSDMLATLDP
jgi:hypothetical protein